MSRSKEQPTPPVERMMEEAAEKRAAGCSWTKVAEQLQRSVDTVRKWPVRYPELWRRLLSKAREQHVTDASAEAISILRTHLRDEDKKLAHDAAKVIIQRLPGNATKETSNDTDAYVENLDDLEERNLIDALDAIDDSAAA